MTNTYVRTTCTLCGQVISSNGLARSSHMNMHVREGYVTKEGWHDIRYPRTDKPFDIEAYQRAHPDRAYNDDDYFPITGHPKDAKIRRKHIKAFVARKGKQDT